MKIHIAVIKTFHLTGTRFITACAWPLTPASRFVIPRVSRPRGSTPKEKSPPQSVVSRILSFSESDALAWARQQIKTPLSALALLRAFVGESTSNPIGSYYVGKHKNLNLKSLEEVAPLTDWDRSFAKLKKPTLSPDDSANLAVYEKAKKRRQKGLPDNDWRTMRDEFEDEE